MKSGGGITIIQGLTQSLGILSQHSAQGQGRVAGENIQECPNPSSCTGKSLRLVVLSEGGVTPESRTVTCRWRCLHG